jgi:hypothetical protein
MIEMGMHKGTLEKVEILKRYYPTESYDFILEQFQKAGIARGFSRSKIQNLASRFGIKRLSVTDKIIKEEFIKIKTPWDIRLAKPIYSAHETAVWCSYKTGRDRDVMLKLPVDKQTLEFMEVEKMAITKSSVKGLHDNEFLCWRCNIIHDRSRARQKGKSGGNKCKACYNLGRREEKEKNPQARIKNNLHNYTNIAYTGLSSNGSPCYGKPGSKMYEMIGCTAAEFRKHIESQFQEGWSHENRGTLWEIDHIIPYNNFDLTDSEQVKQVMHYTNVRPLSIKENRTKGDRLVCSVSYESWEELRAVYGQSNER